MEQSDQSGPRSPGSSPPSGRASGYLRLAPLRYGVLIVDLENALGQTSNSEIPKLDPAWILDKAKRLFTLHTQIVVANLDKPNPLTGKSIADYETLKPWSDAGFTIVHAPAKSISDKGVDGVWRHSHFKDQTDSTLRAQMHLWSGFSEVTDLVLASHDVDFAETVESVRRPTHNRTKTHIVTLSARKEYLASKLRQAADSRVSAFWYNAAISAFLLDQRHWWDPKEPQDAKKEKVLSWFDGISAQNDNIKLQLLDMQDLLRFLVNELRALPPGSPDTVQLTYKELRDAVHGHLAKEKIQARLDVPRQRADHSDLLLLENTDLTLPIAQAQACQISLDELIGVLRLNKVIMHEKEPVYGVTKLFVDPDHPAVQQTIDLDFR
ncbi:NYN domain-containing protein [Patescibacteria group bacterium]|nr:NYN domain-containing protein [Patescibacteria group bacterium]